MRAFLLSSLAVSCLFFTGCNEFSQQSGLVAVVDLDQVALDVGRAEAIKAAVDQREATLNRQLAGAKASYETQLQEAKNKLGEQPTQEQQLQFTKLKQQASKQLTQIAQKAKNNLGQHQAKLRLRFRDEAKAVARQVAKEKGLSIVVTKNESVVLVYDDAADITSEVSQRLQALSNPTPQAPAASLGQSGW